MNPCGYATGATLAVIGIKRSSQSRTAPRSTGSRPSACSLSVISPQATNVIQSMESHIEAYAPGFKKLVLHVEVRTPRELEKEVPSLLEYEGDSVVIRHLYIERRMVPLNLYLQNGTDADVDHGIKDSAVEELRTAVPPGRTALAVIRDALAAPAPKRTAAPSGG